MTKRSETLGPEQAASFGHTLLACARLFDELGQARLNARLGEAIARPSVMRLVPYVTPEGIRPTELARLADVSKQAVGQTLAFLEKRGLVELAADPADGRAVLVRMTKTGVRVSRMGLESLAGVQRDVEKRIGARVLADTFAGLRKILAALEDSRPSNP